MRIYCFFILVLSTFTSYLSALDTFFIAKCYNPKTNEPIYDIHHTLKYKTGKLVSAHSEYFYPNTNTKFAQRDYNYIGHLFAPAYDIIDERFNMLQKGVYIQGNIMNISLQRNPQALIEKKIFNMTENTVTDGGMSLYIQNKWNDLMNNKEYEFYFFIPTKLDSFKCKLYKIKEDVQTVTFVIHIANPILHLFSGDLESVYDKRTRKILSYKGLANVYDNNGEKALVLMKFQYPNLLTPKK